MRNGDRSRPSAEVRQPGPDKLPYDPEEWERRLAVARVRREKVLKEREAEKRRTAALRNTATGAPARPDLAIHQQAAVRSVSPELPEAQAHVIPPETCVTLAGSAAQVRQEPRRYRLKSALAGLVVGCVAGTALATIWSLDSITAELGNRFASRSSVDLSSPSVSRTDAGSSPAPAPSPAQRTERTSPEEGGPESSAQVPALLFGPGAPEVDPLASRLKIAAPELAAANGDLRTSPPTLGFAGAQTPAAPFAPREATRPSEWSAMRVVVRAPEGLAPDRREDAMSRLIGGDWPSRRMVATPYTISETHVRYYHSQDRAAAEDLAALFGASARDFTSFSPSPDEGLLELWLSNQGSLPPPPKKPEESLAIAAFVGGAQSSLQMRSIDGRSAPPPDGSPPTANRTRWPDSPWDGIGHGRRLPGFRRQRWRGNLWR